MNSPSKLFASLLLAVTISLVASPLAQATPFVPTGGEAVEEGSPGLIIGLIIGAVAVLGGLLFLILFLRRRKKEDQEAPAAAEAGDGLES